VRKIPTKDLGVWGVVSWGIKIRKAQLILYRNFGWLLAVVGCALSVVGLED